jgi:hypothetical protein
MTTLELLEELHNRDIALQCVDGEIKVNAPKGAVSPELRAALLEHKPALLALLTAQDRLCSIEDELAPSLEVLPEDSLAQAEQAPSESEDEISMECCVCGAEVEYYSESGIAYCQAHWETRLQSLIAPWLVEQAPEQNVATDMASATGAASTTDIEPATGVWASAGL